MSSTQGDPSSTRYQVELGDGVRAIYQNLTVLDEPIQHRYQQPGVYRVTVQAENTAGHDRATLYIQVTGESGVLDGGGQLLQQKLVQDPTGSSLCLPSLLSLVLPQVSPS